MSENFKLSTHWSSWAASRTVGCSKTIKTHQTPEPGPFSGREIQSRGDSISYARDPLYYQTQIRHQPL